MTNRNPRLYESVALRKPKCAVQCFSLSVYNVNACKYDCEILAQIWKRNRGGCAENVLRFYLVI